MNKETRLLNEPIDINADFWNHANDLYLPARVISFNKDSLEGRMQWQLHRWINDRAFNTGGQHLERQNNRHAFWSDLPVDPEYSFKISWINERSLRIQMRSSGSKHRGSGEASLMLVEEPVAKNCFTLEENQSMWQWKTGLASLEMNVDDWKLSLRDKDGRELTSTLGLDLLKQAHPKSIPFSILNRREDNTRSFCVSLALAPDEKIVGGGESFTSLNKTGQKLFLYTTDTQSTATQKMYKPIPFFMSSNGYGMFIHTSAPVTMDIGHTHAGSNSIMIGDDELDIFIFIGSPKEILQEYTSLTGRSPLPPLWSFGLWMSRLSYQSEAEVRTVASKLRENRIPCDVIHIDAGWFDHGVNCDFRFNEQRFPAVDQLSRDLRKQGFRICIWQLPYISANNRLFDEVLSNFLYVKDSHGGAPPEDLVLDLTNEETRNWYASKIKSVLQKGISTIKADFGEAAPFYGQYKNGLSGFYEHNLYPLRYNKLIYETVKAETGDDLIWARSAWAGSQRYPIHWGGDSEVSDIGMAGTLRAGLSLGLCGFTFWSHDIGGFFDKPDEELFNRWTFFGMLSSHSRVHGLPPREPWEFSKHFLNSFRKMAEMRYRLLPYLFTQSAMAAKNGLPILRALLAEYPSDPVAWLIEDQYLFGNDIMIAPIMRKNQNVRQVYLPEGKWIDFQSGRLYEGSGWWELKTGDLPGIILIKTGAIIPQANAAASTAMINWNEIFFVVYADGPEATGHYYDPSTKIVKRLNSEIAGDDWRWQATSELNSGKLISYKSGRVDR